MRHLRFSCLVLVMALVGLTGVLSDPATGQTPPSAAVPAIPQGSPPGYSAHDLFGNSYYRVAPADGPSPKEQELERQSQNLARQYSQAQNRDEKDKLRDQLNEVLQKQFDAQQQRRKSEIDRIE